MNASDDSGQSARDCQSSALPTELYPRRPVQDSSTDCMVRIEGSESEPDEDRSAWRAGWRGADNSDTPLGTMGDQRMTAGSATHPIRPVSPLCTRRRGAHG